MKIYPLPGSAPVLMTVLMLSFVAAGHLGAQQSPSPNNSASPLAPGSSQKPRVFITDSESWEVRGSAGGSNGTFAGSSHGGARPQTAEIIKTFGERCPEVTPNNRQELADYIVVLDHEGGKGYLQHRNKVAVFEHVSGDIVMSHSTLSLGGSVKDACEGIEKNWASHGFTLASAVKQAPIAIAEPNATATNPMATTPPPATASASLAIDSTPPGADIEIDGGFVGNTPSTVIVAAGAHDIAVKKKGFVSWTKKLNVTGGSIHLSAELDQEPAKQ